MTTTSSTGALSLYPNNDRIIQTMDNYFAASKDYHSAAKSNYAAAKKGFQLAKNDADRRYWFEQMAQSAAELKAQREEYLVIGIGALFVLGVLYIACK